jgi:GTP-binding protein HflX
VTGEGMGQLLRAVDEVLPIDPIVRATFSFPAGDGATLAVLHEFGRVLETKYHGQTCEVDVEIPESVKRRIDARE